MSEFPENPILVRVRRGDFIESCHRGSWALVDTAGTVLDGAGDMAAPVFARSSVKALQALPLIETGAADAVGLTDRELGLALASHSAEELHTEIVSGLLDRLDLGVEHLLCGPQVPSDRDARARLFEAGLEPTALHNNCSGKHAGFLCLARHLGVAPEDYIDPESEAQQLVFRAVSEACDLQPDDLTFAIDGCSAPTLRMPLAKLATGFARVANPEGFAPERAAALRRMTRVVAAEPALIAASKGRFCTDVSRATRGRLFPKVGAEAVYVIGEIGGGRGLAVKIDDGSNRALHAAVVGIGERLGLFRPDEAEALATWTQRRMRNRAGLDVGSIEVVA